MNMGLDLFVVYRSAKFLCSIVAGWLVNPRNVSYRAFNISEDTQKTHFFRGRHQLNIARSSSMRFTPLIWLISFDISKPAANEFRFVRSGNPHKDFILLDSAHDGYRAASEKVAQTDM
jgi:hypothetical protein